MSGIVGARAISLVERGGIEEWVHPRVFFTRGLSGDKEYMVVVTAGRTICNCPAGNRGVDCYHALAAKMLCRDRQPPPARAAMGERIRATGDLGGTW